MTPEEAAKLYRRADAAYKAAQVMNNDPMRKPVSLRDLAIARLRCAEAMASAIEAGG